MPIEGAVDALRQFGAQKPLAGSHPHSEGTDTALTAFASEVPIKETPAVKPARQFNWRSIALGLLALVAVAQGGLIVYWFTAGRAAAEYAARVAAEPDPLPLVADALEWLLNKGENG